MNHFARYLIPSALCAFTTACGSGSGPASHFIGIGAVPTPVMAGSPDATPTPEQVMANVFDASGAPMPGASVSVNAANGANIVDDHADATGMVMANVPAQGMMLSAAPSNGNYQIFGIAGLAPGMVVSLGGAPMGSATAYDYTVTVPGTFPGATSYQLNDGCGPQQVSAGQSYQGTATASCLPGEQISFLLAALDASGNPLAFSFITNQPLTDPSVAAVLPDWTPATTTTTVSITNILSSVTAGYVIRLNGLTYFEMESSANAPNALVPMAMPAGFADNISLIFTNYAGSGYASTEYRMPTAPADFVINASLNIPAIPTLTVTEGADATVPTLSWDALPDSANAVTVAAQWADPTSGNQWGETILAPAVSSTFSLPAIPQAFGAAQPDAAAIRSYVAVGFISVNNIDGFLPFASAQGNQPVLPTTCTIQTATIFLSNQGD